MTNIGRSAFYTLSFTWGLPMSLVGALVCGTLMCFGYKPRRYGHAYYIEIGESRWGGLEFGWFFLTSKGASESIRRHELGHAYQNACILGWVFPIFWLVSASRYWLKRWGAKIDYYAWWFESQASRIGTEVMRNEPR